MTAYDLKTILDSLYHFAHTTPSNLAYVFHNNTGETSQVSYKDLFDKVNSLARVLLRNGCYKERGLILIPPGIDFIVSFLAALQCGMIAVPTFPPTNNRKAGRLQAIQNDCEAKYILTTSEVLEQFDTTLITSQGQKIILVDENGLGVSSAPATEVFPIMDTDEVAFLQYTSGSTGNPKGVMISHKNIIVNLQLIRGVIDPGYPLESHIMVSWLPPYHDMGLIFGTLFPLFCGFPCHLMSPSLFTQEPFRWLKIISDVRGTITGVPDFAFDLCYRTVPEEDIRNLDLSSLKVIFNGSEPIKLKNVENFCSKFAKAKFEPDSIYPAYGLAEATLLVTSRKTIDIARNSKLSPNQVESQGFVNCGRVGKNHEVLVINPQTHSKCGNYEEGEIWVWGNSVSKGYWGKPQSSKETFHGNIEGDDRKYLKTGDLGFLDEDGNLFVSGRLKDIIIINGQNYYPHDIEETVYNCHSALIKNGCAAFSSLDNEQNEEFIVVQELHRHFKEFDLLRNVIRRQLYDIYDITPYQILFIRDKSLPKTLTGKIQRQKCKQLYLEDKLKLVNEQSALQPINGRSLPIIPLHIENCTREEKQLLLEKYLLDICSYYLNTTITSSDLDSSYISLGFDSIRMSLIIARIQADTQKKIPFKLLASNVSIRGIATYLGEKLEDDTVNYSSPSNHIQSGISLASYSQQRLYFLDSFLPEKRIYSLPVSIDIDGVLDHHSFIKAVRELVDRHDSLRLILKDVDGLIIQEYVSSDLFDVTYVDISDIPDIEKDKCLRKIKNEINNYVFDLSVPFLFLIKLIKYNDAKYTALLNFHHIIMDGQSILLFLQELSVTYNKLIHKNSKEMPKVRLSYEAFSAWQRKTISGRVLNNQLEYWKLKLASPPDISTLTLDFDRPADPSYQGDIISQQFPSECIKQLKCLAKDQNVTLFCILFSAFFIILHRFTRHSDLVIGTPFSGRTAPHTEDLLGLLMNTLPIRLLVNENETFAALLSRLNEHLLEAQDNQDIPFDMLINKLGIDSVINRNPLFQILFTIRENWEKYLNLSDVKINIINEDNKYSKFDMSIFIQESRDSYVVEVEYSAELFRKTTIEYLIQSYFTLLESIIENPNCNINNLSVITPSEESRILTKFNEGFKSLQKAPTNIIQKFESIVKQYENNVGICFDNKTLTFKEINHKANQVAHYLIEKGAVSGKYIGVSFENSIELVISILAILKTGAAYVPIDSEYPSERIAIILADTETRLLVTQEHLKSKFDKYTGEIISFNLDDAHILKQPIKNPSSIINLESPAYIIYTSGSTGVPKGSIITHKNVVSLLLACDEVYDFNHKDIFCLFHSFAFDVSVWEIWSAFLHGCQLVIIPSMIKKDVQQFIQLIADTNISVLAQTPSALETVLLASPDNKVHTTKLRHIVTAGEKLDISKFKTWLIDPYLQHIKITNMYGITETTTHSTFKTLTIDDTLTNPAFSAVGYPLSNTKIHILDNDRMPVPVGVVGEIYVGGHGVSQGYLKKPTLSQERFIACPFVLYPDEGSTERDILYRSGDLGRYVHDGSIEYLGRIDNQIKIRGYRIELGELESILNQCPMLERAAVICDNTHPSGPTLIAYIKFQLSPGNINEHLESLRQYLSQKLPSYMIPSIFIPIDNFPLTVNGKINRKQLPAIKKEFLVQQSTQESARDDLEREISLIWQELLDLESVGINDNFFKLGGHSLLLNKMMLRIRAQYGVSVSIRDCFMYPTIAHISGFVRQAQNKAPCKVLRHDSAS